MAFPVQIADISVPVIKADPGPAADQGYDHEDTLLVSLWGQVTTLLAEYSDVSSHATEGTSYSRDLARAEKRLTDTYTAYLLRKSALLTAEDANPLHTRTTRSRTVDFSAIPFHQL